MKDIFKSETLVTALAQASNLYAENIALELKGESYTYRELFEKGFSLAEVMGFSSSSYCGIFCERGLSAYLGILAAVFSGRAYVPFDLSIDADKLKNLLIQIDCEYLIVDDAGRALLEPFLDQLSNCKVLYCGEDLWNSEQVIQFSYGKLEASEIRDEFSFIEHQSVLYVLFTSGSTGNPKGVPVTHENLLTYLRQMNEMYPLLQNDRCTQAFEFTFDPSVQDMFLTWLSGATLCFMDAKERLAAHTFIYKNKITVWNSIPSLLKMLLPLRGFSAEKLLSLRRVFFNGEALNQSVVGALQEKVPQAQLINLYGLTETTINIAHYLWETDISEPLCRNGIVPIGHFFKETVYLIDETTHEMCLSSPQIFKSYLELDSASKLKNESIFTIFEGRRFIKTGDILEQDDQGLWHYRERIDEQVKLSGHRVDLFEIQSVLETLSGDPSSLILMYEYEGINRLAALIENESIDEQMQHDLLSALNEHLPKHLHISGLFCLKEYPRLTSGKVNKKLLREVISKTV